MNPKLCKKLVTDPSQDDIDADLAKEYKHKTQFQGVPRWLEARWLGGLKISGWVACLVRPGEFVRLRLTRRSGSGFPALSVDWSLVVPTFKGSMFHVFDSVGRPPTSLVIAPRCRTSDRSRDGPDHSRLATRGSRRSGKSMVLAMASARKWAGVGCRKDHQLRDLLFFNPAFRPISCLASQWVNTC